MKTLQTHYNQIQKGEGNEEIFLKESKSQYPTLIHNSANYGEAVGILKKYNKIVESNGEQKLAPSLQDFIHTFKQHTNEGFSDGNMIPGLNYDPQVDRGETSTNFADDADVDYEKEWHEIKLQVMSDYSIDDEEMDSDRGTEDQVNRETDNQFESKFGKPLSAFESNNEGMSDEEFADAEEAERLEAHPEKDSIKKVQKLMRGEKAKVNEHNCKCGKHKKLTEAAKKVTAAKPDAKPKRKPRTKKGYNFEDKKKLDNQSGQQVRDGIWCEANDPKNFAKTEQQLIDIVNKNLTKNPLYYVENYAFGIKDLGYKDDLPGLKTSKEAKGKFKSSGYGDLDKTSKANLKENKKTKEQLMFEEIDNIIKNN